jgi:hypothetical protein
MSMVFAPKTNSLVWGSAAGLPFPVRIDAPFAAKAGLPLM